MKYSQFKFTRIKLKMLLPCFYVKVLATTDAVFFNVHFMGLFFTVREPEKALHLYLLNMTWDIVELVKGYSLNIIDLRELNKWLEYHKRSLLP